MDTLAIGVGLLIFYLFGRFLRLISGQRGLFGIFGDLFLGWHADDWPRGVQEENRERPWGRPDPTKMQSALDDPELPPPALVPVRSAVRLR